eukprot:c21407_g1_i1 orf=204-536(-)
MHNMGNQNNSPDVIDSNEESPCVAMGFDIPRSPEISYDNPFPGAEDESKEPPAVPPHLQRSLLNPLHNVELNDSLPNPPHVVLNHLHIENGGLGRPVLVLGLTHLSDQNM